MKTRVSDCPLVTWPILAGQILSKVPIFVHKLVGETHGFVCFIDFIDAQNNKSNLVLVDVS